MKTWQVRVPVFVAVAAALWMNVSGSTLRAAEQNKDVPWEKIYQNTMHSFVIVSYHLKKSNRPSLEAGYGLDREYGTVLQRILDRNATDVLGVILSDKGEILTFDRDPVYLDTVASITVKGADGKALPATFDRLLVKTSGRVLRLTGHLPSGWKPLQFTDVDAITPGASLYAVSMKPDKQNHVYIRPCEYGRNWRSAEPGPCLQAPGVYCVGVICNADGAPVGVTCRDQIDLDPAGPVWKGKDVLEDAGLSQEQQTQLEDKLKQDFAAHIYEITIAFRPEPQEEEAYDVSGRSPFRRYRSGDAGGREVLVYGLGFADDKLLVPDSVSRESAAGIDTITVKVGDEQVPGRFGGVLKSCSATVIELEPGKLPHTASFAADGRLARTEPFWAVYVRELGGMDIQTEFNRWIDEQQGYADLWYPVMERPMQAGCWLLDRRGNPVGLYSQERHEEDRLRPYLLGRQSSRYAQFAMAPSLRGRRIAIPGWSPSYSSDTRVFESAELSGLLNDLPGSYDPRIRHLSKDEQKRRVWLGVEYTAPDKEMVKQLGLRQPTRDGRIGLVVNRVYPGSPAATLGLVEGDVLLTVAVPGAPWPIELTCDERGDFEMPDFEEVDMPKEFEAMGYGMPRRRPWPSRDNYLTRMLAEIGAGTTVTLCYLHDGKKQEQAFNIEQAPPDMLSAARYKNEKLGLTVKELTYEVRAALRLQESDAAIVVTQVEQGTPAALARINPYELIRAIDGEPVGSVETIEKLIAAAQQENRDSVRVTVEWMGKTRLADLKLEAGAPGLPRSLFRGQE
ncbi:MAG: PDZ domain-containing protein [Sedimentisphaerales bacterium]|nr:PDZ domain-containing protein [Sedimentisphaerales bacterium]